MRLWLEGTQRRLTLSVEHCIAGASMVKRCPCAGTPTQSSSGAAGPASAAQPPVQPDTSAIAGSSEAKPGTQDPIDPIDPVDPIIPIDPVDRLLAELALSAKQGSSSSSEGSGRGRKLTEDEEADRMLQEVLEGGASSGLDESSWSAAPQDVLPSDALVDALSDAPTWYDIEDPSSSEVCFLSFALLPLLHFLYERVAGLVERT